MINLEFNSNKRTIANSAPENAKNTIENALLYFSLFSIQRLAETGKKKNLSEKIKKKMPKKNQ